MKQINLSTFGVRVTLSTKWISTRTIHAKKAAQPTAIAKKRVVSATSCVLSHADVQAVAFTTVVSLKPIQTSVCQTRLEDDTIGFSTKAVEYSVKSRNAIHLLAKM